MKGHSSFDNTQMNKKVILNLSATIVEAMTAVAGSYTSVIYPAQFM